MLCGLHANVLMSSHCEDYVVQIFLFNKSAMDLLQMSDFLCPVFWLVILQLQYNKVFTYLVQELSLNKGCGLYKMSG